MNNPYRFCSHDETKSVEREREREVNQHFGKRMATDKRVPGSILYILTMFSAAAAFGIMTFE
jgi:hypothetical protein